MAEEIRWHYRFRNFSRAFTPLREALEGEVETLNQLDREGVIQRFEYTFELAWNLLKDRLEYDGIALPTVTPRQVIRQAFQARFIQDGEAWINMLTGRNLMSHTAPRPSIHEYAVNLSEPVQPIARHRKSL